MNIITCIHCGKDVEIDKALSGQIEARVLAAERHRHAEELTKIKAEQEEKLRLEKEATEASLKERLAKETLLLQQKVNDDLAFEKKKLEQQLASEQRKASADQEELVNTLKADAEHAKKDNLKLREDLGKLMDQLRESNKARENAELEAKKQIAEEEAKIREEATKLADERQRLNIAAKEKQLQDALRVNEELQRKLQQGSQQLQGEIMELDLEEALMNAFRDDEIVPVAKGVNGADISQMVKSINGSNCGMILWEIKRTKNWTDSWIPKLKEDMRNAKADVAVIITEAMPKQVVGDMGYVEGVWVAKASLAMTLGMLLRKSLIDVARQKSLEANRESAAESLYEFVTSRQFAQQIESMVETYQDMRQQVTKERVAYEKLWSQREKQADRLLMNTANIIGSMQGTIGQSSMPRIKGLELDLLGPGDGEPGNDLGL
jgi:hypothetical protein